MPTIDLPHGTVRYRVTGPENAAAPPVVFVHGFLVSSTLWTKTADALAVAGVRSFAADWPLGSHTIALGADADQSPRGIARLVPTFMRALELEDVTLVGNDTGGAICQLLLDIDASRVGRVVLTNCDAFTDFPPAPFDQLFRAFGSPQGDPRIDDPDARSRRQALPGRFRAACHPAARSGTDTSVDRAVPERPSDSSRHLAFRSEGRPATLTARQGVWAVSMAQHY